MKKSIKNGVLLLLVIVVTFFSTVANVSARVIPVAEFVTNLNNSDVFKFFNSSATANCNDANTACSGPISAHLDTENNKMIIGDSTGPYMTFNYGEDYIEYDNRSTAITKEEVEDDLFKMFLIAAIFATIFDMTGYSDKSINSDEIDFTNTYDTYGLQIETEPYSFSGEENGMSYNMSGDYMKYFKMSLDTDKIDALVAQYGVNASENDPNKEVIKTLTPKLEAKNITKNSVSLFVSIPYTNTDPDYTVGCYIYRSKEKDGTYERISDVAVNCMDGSVGLVDENLESNTTYYYKAIVEYGTIYSNIVEVKTKEEAATVETKVKETVDNPKTGVKVPIVTTIILTISASLIFLYTKKKNLLSRI